jgi:L-ribulose-5-phosphate 3-epimerase
MLDRRRFIHLAVAATATTSASTGQAPQQTARAMRLGVVADCQDPDAGIRRVHELGFQTCQMYVSSYDAATAKRLREALDRHGVEGTSLIVVGPGPEVYNFREGPATIGLVPRKYRVERLALLRKASDFAKLAGVPAVQRHFGFLPEDPNVPEFGEAVSTLHEVAAYCKQNGQTFRCETGQETPIALLRVIQAAGMDNVGVNFDGANLILYGKANPVDALDTLGPLVMGVHAKDGRYPTDPYQLGEEVPIGQGKVNFPSFIQRLKQTGYRGPITIEREISGPRQAADIRASKAYLEELIG